MFVCTAVSREAWATLPESTSRPLPATLAQTRNLAHASLETAVMHGLSFQSKVSSLSRRDEGEQGTISPVYSHHLSSPCSNKISTISASSSPPSRCQPSPPSPPRGATGATVVRDARALAFPGRSRRRLRQTKSSSACCSVRHDERRRKRRFRGGDGDDGVQ